MSITLYEKKKFKGNSLVVNRNYRDLRDTTIGRNPSSLTMSDNADAILLFKKDDWKGGVMYYRSKRNMTSLGKKSQGGEFLSGNTVASVRVTPFTLKLNVNVVTTKVVPTDLSSADRYPGGKTSEASIESTFGKALIIANDFFAKENAMIKMTVAQYKYRMNNGKFDLTMAETGSFPPDWKNKGEVDVIVCNTLKGAYGRAKFPWWGKVIIVQMEGRSINQIARTLAHELGHYLGLTHGTGDGAAANIMTVSDLGLNINSTTMTPDQIEEMQQKLARNLTRKGDRIS
jgi:hypothetical protein